MLVMAAAVCSTAASCAEYLAYGGLPPTNTPAPTSTPTITPTPAPTPTPTPIPIGTALDRYDRTVVNVIVPLGLDLSVSGSGVVIAVDPDDDSARILTAYHVVNERPKGVMVWYRTIWGRGKNRSRSRSA